MFWSHRYSATNRHLLCRKPEGLISTKSMKQFSCVYIIVLFGDPCKQISFFNKCLTYFSHGILMHGSIHVYPGKQDNTFKTTPNDCVCVFSLSLFSCLLHQLDKCLCILILLVKFHMFTRNGNANELQCTSEKKQWSLYLRYANLLL